MTPAAPDPAANRRGVIAMMTAMAFFVVNDALVKLAAADLPSGQIIAIRGAFATAIALGWVLASGHGPDLKRLASPLVGLRATLEGAVAGLYITAIATLPIADITAIFLICPLYITALSALVLKERVGVRRWSAVGVGFIGMLLVVKPGLAPAGAEVAIALTLGSVALAGLRDITTRFIPASTPTAVVTLATCAAVALTGLALMAFQGASGPSPRHMATLAAASVALVVGNFAIIVAFRGVEVSAVSPFRYSVIVWAVIAGALIWGDIPDRWSFLGIGLIVAAGLYTLRREAIRRAAAG